MRVFLTVFFLYKRSSKEYVYCQRYMMIAKGIPIKKNCFRSLHPNEIFFINFYIFMLYNNDFKVIRNGFYDLVTV